MAGFGAKVKLSVDRSSAAKAEFNAQINSLTNQIKISNKFVVLQKDMDRVRNSAQTMLNKTPLKIKSIDCSQAVTKLRKDLQNVINSLSIKNGVNITGLVDPAGTGIMATQLDNVAEAARQGQTEVNRFNAQMNVLKETMKSLSSTYKTVLPGGKNEITDLDDLNALIQRYTALQAKIEEIKAKGIASSDEMNTLQQEALAIQTKISNIEKERIATEQLAAAQRKAAQEEKNAAVDQIKADQDRIHNLEKVKELISHTNRDLKKWGAAKGTVQFGEIVDEVNKLKILQSQLESGPVENFGNIYDAARTKISGCSREIQDMGKATGTLSAKIGSLASKFTSWLTVSRVIMEIYQGLKQMVRTVVEVDTAMTELRKVTDETDSSYAKFLDNAAERAKNIGATISDTIISTADFVKLGHNITDASTLADTAIVYKNVGDGIESISQASQSIISTMQAFGIEAQNAMSIVDKFNNIGNKFAITSTGIGDALLNSASALDAAGTTLDESIALITAANEVIQNPEKVGTAMKTLSMYIRASKTEAEEAGISTEGMANSVSELRDEILALTGNKVDIMVDENNFKGIVKIIGELAAIWDTLSETTQVNITELIGGGVRNANIVSALIKNYGTVQEVLAESANSTGSALAENETYLDSIAGKITEFKSAFQELSVTVIGSEFAKGVVEFGTGVLKILTSAAKLVDILGGLLPILTAIAGITLSIKINDIAASIGNIGKSLSSVFDVAKMDGIDSISSFFSAITGSISKTQLAIGGISIALSAAIALYQGHKRALEEQRAAAEDAGNAFSESKNSIDEYIGKIDQLKISIDSGTLSESELYNAKSELYSIQQSLIGTYGDEAAGLDLVNGAIEEQIVLLDQLSAKEADRFLNENNAGIEKATKEMLKERSFYLGQFNDVDIPSVNAIKDVLDKYGEYLNVIEGADETYPTQIFFKGNAEEARDVINDIMSDLREISSEYGDRSLFDSILETSSSSLADANEILDKYKSIYDQAQQAELVRDTGLYQHGDTTQSAAAWMRDYAEAVNDYNDALLTGDPSKINEAKHAFEGVDNAVRSLASGSMSKYAEQINEVSEQLNSSTEKEYNFKVGIKSAFGKQHDLGFEIQSAISRYEQTVADAQKIGVDLEQTVFGNIDLQNRKTIEWTEANIKKFSAELESWGENAQDIIGTVSTVMGTSSEFDGVEIAFSPILQTKKGAQLLSEETVTNYINGLIASASKDGEWDANELLALDAQGILVDGKLIKGLIADIGDTAISTGEAMHFLGENGAIDLAAKDIESAKNALNEFNKSIAGTDAEWANTLKGLELDDIDLLSMLYTDGLQEGEEAFNNLINSAVEVGLISDSTTSEVQKLVAILVDLGVVSGGAFSTAEDAVSEFKSAVSSAKTDVEEILTGITDVQGIIGSQTVGDSISLDDYNTAALNGYSEALEYNNGALQLNRERVNELVEAKVEEQIAYNDARKAMAEVEYAKNYNEIKRLERQLKSFGNAQEKVIDGVTMSRDAIEDQIASLQNSNNELSSVCLQYDLLSSALRDATSAYQQWLAAQSSPNSGEMLDGAIGAMTHIENVLKNTKSEHYLKMNTDDYKTAIDFIVPDSVDKEDVDAVNKYMNDISKYFYQDKEGNLAGLNLAEFCSDAAKMGLMELDEATGKYAIAGERSMQEFAERFGMSLPLIQAIFGEIEEYVDLDFSDELPKTFAQIAESAEEATSALRNNNLVDASKLIIDVSGIEDAQKAVGVLDTTIAEMQKLKISPLADTTDIERANQVIEYCIKQKQLLERPAIMSVDTSLVEGEIGEAIALFQEFVDLQDQIEIGEAKGIDVSQLKNDLDSVVQQINGIDDDVKIGIQIDPSKSLTESDIAAYIDSFQTQEDIKVKLGIDETAIVGYTASDKDATVVYDTDTSEPDKYKPEDKPATVVYGVDHTQVDAYDPPNLEREVRYKAVGDVSSGTGEADGTAHASGTAMAGGNWGTAPGGPTLVGEIKPEIVVDPKTGTWQTVGDNGAEFVNIRPGSIVFNHKQTEALLKYGHIDGRGRSLASGTAMVSGGGIPVIKPQTGYKPWNYGSNSGSGSGSSSSSSSSSNKSSSSSSSKEDDYNPFEEAYKQHQHYLAMEQESLADYLNWLEGAYQDAYRNGYIELDDLYKYEEEVYDGRKELFEDHLNDMEHEISIMEREAGREGDIINMYIDMFNDINSELNKAYARGLTDNDDYVQELKDRQFEYADAIKDIQEDAKDNAMDAVEDLVEYRIKMLKQELENEKDALNDRLDALKDFYSDQKDLLKEAKEEEEYLEEQSEKRKAKSDIEAELAQLQFDDSAWAQKRKLELQAELAEADKDLADFEKDHAYDNTVDFLDKMLEKQEEQIQTQIDAIDAKLNDPDALYNKALKDIQNNTERLYIEMVDYNNDYGDGNPETVKTMWDEARESLDNYMSTFGQAYKNILLVASTNYGITGYASGTSSATPGLHKVFEQGDEYLFKSSDGNRYRVFSGGEKVLNAGATNFLYNFANSGKEILAKIFSGLTEAAQFKGVSPTLQPVQVTMGDIIVQGNASEKTVSEIRRAQREETSDLLKRLAKLNK